MMVTTTLNLGGTERHIAQIAPALAARGYAMSVFCLIERGEQADAVAARGVPVLAPPGPASGWAALLPRPARATLALIAAMRETKPAIAHFFLPMPYILGTLAAYACRTPIRIMSRRSLNLYQRKHRGIATLERALHRRTDLVLANSQRIAQELATEGVPPERLGLITNGIDLDRFSSARDTSAARGSLGLGPGTLVLTIIANLIPYKGHLDLIAALAGIAGRLPADWQLMIVGRDDGEGAAIRAMAAANGLSDHVQLLGARTDVPEILAATDIALLVSHEEGFSNAIIEAMAAGLPLIVTDVGGNGEAVVDGQTGLVVPSRDAAAVGAAILRLASQPALRQTMGMAGRARADQHYSLDACVERYASTYRALLEGQPLDASVSESGRQPTAPAIPRSTPQREA